MSTVPRKMADELDARSAVTDRDGGATPLELGARDGRQQPVSGLGSCARGTRSPGERRS
jgi:hypothetical protein